MSTTRLCDVCKKPITGDVRYSAGRIDYDVEFGELPDRYDSYDICPHCWTKIAEAYLA